MRRDADGTFFYEPPKRRVRFLMTDGTTADVVCERDDSNMREALLHVLNPGHKKETYDRTIAGSVNLGPQEQLTLACEPSETKEKP